MYRPQVIYWLNLLILLFSIYYVLANQVYISVDSTGKIENLVNNIPDKKDLLTSNLLKATNLMKIKSNEEFENCSCVVGNSCLTFGDCYGAAAATVIGILIILSTIGIIVQHFAGIPDEFLTTHHPAIVDSARIPCNCLCPIQIREPAHPDMKTSVNVIDSPTVSSES
ncbi:hypothetical protein cand_024530 [Cryptosporidium andersoni]|uniref:Uncharacterized protein n=1 Tax=Cryptosporidium andersoni TaxID=117008 RepID=A0A1J4MRF5_9CRYT|nr:hypothetical protein cand_024530 [Cryptosporidium andersoni]